MLICTTKISLLFICFVLARADPGGPGVVATVAQKGVSEWVKDFEGEIDTILGNLQIPDQDIHFSHGAATFSNIHTHDFGNEQFSFQLTPSPGIQIVASFNIMLGLNFHYNIGGIAGNGHCEFKMDGSGITVSGTLGASDGKLALLSEGASVSLNGLGHDCNGISGNILNVILDQFNGKIKDLIQNQGSQQLKDALAKKAAPALSNVNLDFPTSDGFALIRFDAQAVTYDKEATAIVLALKGDVVQQADLQDPAGTFPRSLPPWDLAFNNADIQIAVSSWSLLTGLVNYQRAGRLAIDIKHTELPDHSPVQLNTREIGVFAPGLWAKYTHKWMQLAVAVEEGSEVHMHSNEGIRMEVPVGMRFQVLRDNSTLEEAFALRVHVTVGVDVTVLHNATGTFVQPNITALKFPAKVANSTVGPVLLLPKIIDLVSFVVQKVGIPYVNKCFRWGVPLPSNPNVHLTNFQVGMREEFMVIASDVDLKPSARPVAWTNAILGRPADGIFLI